MDVGAYPYVAPATVVFVGTFLLGFLLLHHGFSEIGRNWNTIRIDPQHMARLAMGVLLLGGGTVEVLRVRGTLEHPVWDMALPGVLAAIGLLFVAHTQHGDHGAVARATPEAVERKNMPLR